MNIAYTVIKAPPGDLLAAETKRGLTFMAFGPEELNKLKAFARRWFPDSKIVSAKVQAASQIREYLKGKR
ncbi:MAG: hypothetical protein JRI85_12645, partial [Deltaproteobacteria bacterium]|nr:hypothetical protein [Deltaproteobacteria bacterium]